MVKRAFDVIGSLTGLLLSSPILLLAAVWIKLDSQGPVFYRGIRAGLSGRPFRIFKLRTMVVNADRIGGPSTPSDDHRITRAGAWLRRHKLDELPQLLNVLRGDMSLVGPRPEVFSETLEYTPEEKLLFGVRPGITDWASIRFRNEADILHGSPDPHQTYHDLIRPEKIQLGLAYVEHHTFRVDVTILFETLRVILFPQSGSKLPAEITRELRLNECGQNEHR